MKLRKIVPLLLLGVSAVAIAPVVTSCKKDKGQDYSKLNTFGSFTITSSKDSENLKSTANKHILVQPANSETFSKFKENELNNFPGDQQLPTLYWELVYRLADLYSAGAKLEDNQLTKVEYEKPDGTSNFNLTLTAGDKNVIYSNLGFDIVTPSWSNHFFKPEANKNKVIVSPIITSTENLWDQIKSFDSRTFGAISITGE